MESYALYYKCIQIDFFITTSELHKCINVRHKYTNLSEIYTHEHEGPSASAYILGKSQVPLLKLRTSML